MAQSMQDYELLYTDGHEAFGSVDEAHVSPLRGARDIAWLK